MKPCSDYSHRSIWQGVPKTLAFIELHDQKDNDSTSRSSSEAGGPFSYHLRLADDLLALARLSVLCGLDYLCPDNQNSLNLVVAILKCRTCCRMPKR